MTIVVNGNASRDGRLNLNDKWLITVAKFTKVIQNVTRVHWHTQFAMVSV